MYMVLSRAKRNYDIRGGGSVDSTFLFPIVLYFFFFFLFFPIFYFFFFFLLEIVGLLPRAFSHAGPGNSAMQRGDPLSGQNILTHFAKCNAYIEFIVYFHFVTLFPTNWQIYLNCKQSCKIKQPLMISDACYFLYTNCTSIPQKKIANSRTKKTMVVTTNSHRKTCLNKWNHILLLG